VLAVEKWGRRVANKVVKNFALDQELIEELQRLSAERRESMSLLVREALRSHLQIEASK
jgi:predicted transcriptional regulator